MRFVLKETQIYVTKEYNPDFSSIAQLTSS